MNYSTDPILSAMPTLIEVELNIWRRRLRRSAAVQQAEKELIAKYGKKVTKFFKPDDPEAEKFYAECETAVEEATKLNMVAIVVMNTHYDKAVSTVPNGEGGTHPIDFTCTKFVSSYYAKQRMKQL